MLHHPAVTPGGLLWWYHTAAWLVARSSPGLPYSCQTYLRLCLIGCRTSSCGGLTYSCHTRYKLQQAPRVLPHSWGVPSLMSDTIAGSVPCVSDVLAGISS